MHLKYSKIEYSSSKRRVCLLCFTGGFSCRKYRLTIPQQKSNARAGMHLLPPSSMMTAKKYGPCEPWRHIYMTRSSNGRKTQPQTWPLASILRQRYLRWNWVLQPSLLPSLKPNRGFAVLVPCWLEVLGSRVSGEAGIWRYLKYGHVAVPQSEQHLDKIVCLQLGWISKCFFLCRPPIWEFPWNSWEFRAVESLNCLHTWALPRDILGWPRAWPQGPQASILGIFSESNGISWGYNGTTMGLPWDNRINWIGSLESVPAWMLNSSLVRRTLRSSHLLAPPGTRTPNSRRVSQILLYFERLLRERLHKRFASRCTPAL